MVVAYFHFIVMLNFHDVNLNDFIRRLSVYHLATYVCRNDKTWLLHIILQRSFTLKLYLENIITREELDENADELNKRLKRRIVGCKFDNDYILNTNAILVVDSNNVDDYRKTGYLMYDKEKNFYYIDLSLIMYNRYKIHKNYVRNTMEK